MQGAITASNDPSMNSKIYTKIRKHRFNPNGIIGILINPSFTFRRQIYKFVSSIELSGSILDVGCGSKPYLHLFKKNKPYIGVDVYISGHDHTTSRVDVYYDGKNLPFEDESFSNVVIFEVLEHVEDVDTMLNEIHRVIKPGGKVVLTIPFLWPEHEMPFDNQRYTSIKLPKVLAMHGLEPLKIVKLCVGSQAIGQLIIEYIRDCCPRLKPIQYIIQIFVISPITILFLCLSKLLPRNNNFFLGMGIIAKKGSANSLS